MMAALVIVDGDARGSGACEQGRHTGHRQLTSGGWPGRSEPLGGDAVGDRYLIEPAASRFACWAVETCDVGLEVDDRCAVDEVHTGEPYGRPGHVEDLDEAEPDGVDPFRPPGGWPRPCAEISATGASAMQPDAACEASI
jgi:hypothetical protein